MGVLASIPAKGLIKMAIGYLSDLVEKIAPEDLTPEEKARVQKYTGTAYAALRNFGPDLVASTENDLDDLALLEAFEICEAAAVKYALELNPREL